MSIVNKFKNNIFDGNKSLLNNSLYQNLYETILHTLLMNTLIFYVETLSKEHKAFDTTNALSLYSSNQVQQMLI